MIDSYRFGEIVINGKKYSSDVVIFPDRVRDSWWRKTGHELRVEDIAEVITENPEVLVVGSGASGLMKVLPEVEQVAQARGIKLIAETTDKACNTYNHLSQSQRVVATLHLTC
ncbi:Mth938-like domain-containing protein [Chloroflexota bacterium]